MGSMVADVVPEIALLVAGVVVLLFALFAPRRHQWVAGLLAAGGALTAAALAWIRLRADDQMVTFTGSYAVDHLTDWAVLLTCAATVVVITLSVPWFRTDPRHGEYYTLLLFSALGAILLAGATDLIQLVIALLLSSVTGYVLAAYHRQSRSASEAGIKYFLLGALANTVMLIGVAYLFGLAGTATYDGLERGLEPASPALVVGAALVLVALAFKLGAVPAHAWVPDVAQGAPAPAAAFITTAPKIGGLIALARFVAVLPEDAIGWRPLIAVLAAATMTLGNLAALWSDDLRRLLGWSAISQTGYGLMAVVALGRSDLDLAALLYFLLAYLIGNLAAFAVVVALRGRTAREDHRGLARRRPWLAAVLALAFLSFIGIPPLVGFPAKLLLFGVAIDAGYTWLAIAAIINSVVSIFYYARFLAPIYFDQAVGRFPLLSRSASGAAVVCGSALLVAGILVETFVARFWSVLVLVR
jgi:NADH-quinone oxidoreductase subunit N